MLVVFESVTTSFGGVPSLIVLLTSSSVVFELYRNPVTSCNAYTIYATPPGRFRLKYKPRLKPIGANLIKASARNVFRPGGTARS